MLVALFLYAHFRTGTGAAKKSSPLIVSVTGHDWWWELRYRDPASGGEIVLANEIHLPAGRSVVLGLNSGDVIHSFWVPALAGKVDMIPGRVQQLRLEAAEPGRHRGQCAEFCGEQHAQMALEVVVEPAPAFDAWLRAQARAGRRAARRRSGARPGAVPLGRLRRLSFDPRRRRRRRAPAPTSPMSPRAACIGAGIVAADEAGFARWIGEVQHLKPGARMPEYSRLDPAALAALASLLGQLR